MSNSNRVNQPPSGKGKKQSTTRGAVRKLGKRSEVVQAQRHHPELNIGESEDEPVTLDDRLTRPARPKSGR